MNRKGAEKIESKKNNLPGRERLDMDVLPMYLLPENSENDLWLWPSAREREEDLTCLADTWEKCDMCDTWDRASSGRYPALTAPNDSVNEASTRALLEMFRFQ